MSFYIRKNGVTKKLAVIPQGYPAELIGYDNTSSGLTADEVQDAIDEVNDSKVSKSGDTMSGKLTIDRQNGSTSAIGYSQLELGNDIAEGAQNNSSGLLKIFGKNSYNGMIYDHDGLTNDREYYLPDKTGTLALTSDVIDQKLYRIVVASNNSSSIKFKPYVYSRYAIQIIGNGNSISYMGNIMIETAQYNYVRATVPCFKNGTYDALTATYDSTDESITISNLDQWGYYTFISPYPFIES